MGGLRGATLVIGGLETAAALAACLFFLSGNSDPLGANIAQAVAVVIAIPVVVFVLPALVLAWRRRWVAFALALEFGGPLVYAVALRFS